MDRKEITKQAVTNALGVYVYVLLVALLMWQGNALFGTEDTMLSMAAFLMLFVLSAGVVGTFILGRPILLYLDGKKKEAVTLFANTIVGILVLTLLSMLVLILF